MTDDLLMKRLEKSVAMTAKVPVNQPDQDEEGEALKRLKELVAETRKLADRAEALVASMRRPPDYHKNT